MTARLRRTTALLVAVLGAALVLSSCSATELPLPGGTDTGDDPMVVRAEFNDVLDLVPQSTVKINDVSVGKITDVQLDGETALVTMELPRGTDLPSNAVAEIRQTSLLGEKFVSLSPPESGASTTALADGDTIALDATSRNPEVEEVLGALSLLLNGGGVAQLKTITTELNKALEGREDNVKSVFRQVEDLMGQLDEGKADIVRALEGLNRLSLATSDQIGTIDQALQELPSALRTIDRQRADLVRMLRAVNELGDVGVRVIRASKQSTIQSFRQLVPVLDKFAESGDAFAKSFHAFLTYPFVDEVVGRDPQVARDLRMGDYTNLSITLDVKVAGTRDDDGDGLPDPPTDLPTVLDPVETVGLVTRCLRSGDLGSKPCRKLLKRPQKLLNLQEECQKRKNRDKDVCRQLNALQLPNLPGPGGGNGGGGGGGGLGGVLDGITGGGLPRPPFGRQGDYGPRGPTMGELMEVYDADLVSLLVPGMVTR
ncbi:MCE family protein [Nocardioides sp. GXQ0305]|uniref:MCE family protein n=1 Tax=Nocardioides sp. GXQ0305 TaxID=3423912 RepID=UPI003D7EB141